MKLIAFSHHSRAKSFPIKFKLPNWHLVKFEKDKEYDADVYWQLNVQGRFKKIDHAFAYIDSTNKPKLVCESTPFRKNSYIEGDVNTWRYRVGWEHFLNTGKFYNSNSPSDRWEQICKAQKIKIKPYSDGEYILICLQNRRDTTLNSLYDNWNTYEEWFDDLINNIRKYSDRKIIVRPHLTTGPWVAQNIARRNDPSIELSKTFKNRRQHEGGKGLESEIRSSKVVLGYNTNALVEAVCLGKPVIALSKESMTWDISDNLKNLESLNYQINRTQWLHDMAYTQWTLEEIANGKAWEHLKQGYTNER